MEFYPWKLQPRAAPVLKLLSILAETPGRPVEKKRLNPACYDLVKQPDDFLPDLRCSDAAINTDEEREIRKTRPSFCMSLKINAIEF